MRKLLLILLSMTLICGCSSKGKTVDNMVKYMNQKYLNDEFKYSAPSGGSSGSSSKTIIVSSKKYPDKDIFVRYDGTEYYDNYLGVAYEQKTLDLIYETLSSVIDGEIFISYDVSRYACPNEDEYMTFYEYARLKESNIGFVAVVNYLIRDKEKFERDIEQTLRDHSLCCVMSIYFEDDVQKVKDLTSEGFSSYIYDKSFDNSVTVVMDDINTVNDIRWSY